MPLYLETFRVADVLDPVFAAGTSAQVAAEIEEARAEGFTASGAAQ